MRKRGQQVYADPRSCLAGTATDGLFRIEQSLKVTDVKRPLRTAVPPVLVLTAFGMTFLALTACEKGKPRNLPPDPMAVAPPADIAPVSLPELSSVPAKRTDP